MVELESAGLESNASLAGELASLATTPHSGVSNGPVLDLVPVVKLYIGIWECNSFHCRGCHAGTPCDGSPEP